MDNDSVVAAASAKKLPCILDVDGPNVPNWAWGGYLAPLDLSKGKVAVKDQLPSTVGTYQDKTYAFGFYDVALTLYSRRYGGVFDRVPAARFLLNSIGISAVTVVLGIFVNSLAAFALSRMRWRGRKIVLTAVIATLIVPFETFALPLVWWVNQLPWLQVNGFHFTLAEGWLDTYQVQILPFVANAFSIFLFHQYFQSIPKELDEAAVIDGAGWFGIYRRIVMPLSGPAIATVAILTFLPAWNSYLWPLMVVQSEELRPVVVGIQYFFQLNPSWGEIMAYSSMTTVPVLALFVAFQRAFVNSIASSGVKG